MKYSPTAISTFRMCKRKWAWSKLDGIPSVQNKSAELGEAVHKVLEAWLEKGTPIDTTTRVGKIASKGLKHLPLPGVAEVEKWFHIETELHEYHGKVDASWTGDRVVVLDHKTTSDLKWAKTEEDLRTDEQGVMYAAQAMLRHGVEEVELRWVYYVTQEGKEKSKKVSLVVTRAEVEPEFEKIEETANEMSAILAKNLKAKDLEPTVTACDAYGGCQYVENCNLSSKERMKALMAQQSLAEKLKARQTGTAAPSNGTTGPAVHAPVQEATPVAAAPAAVKLPKVNKLQKIAAAAKKTDAPAINPPESNQESVQTQTPAATVTTVTASVAGATSKQKLPETTRDSWAAQLMAASIARGEPFDDELQRAKTAYSRADAMIMAR